MVTLHEKKGIARRRVDAGLNLINGEWERIKKVETDGRKDCMDALLSCVDVFAHEAFSQTV